MGLGPPDRARLSLLLLLAAWALGSAGSAPCVDPHHGLDVKHAAAAPLWKKGKWSQRCVEYRRVCFDQEAVISHDPAFSPDNTSSAELPRLDLSTLRYIWAGRGDGSMNPDVFAHTVTKYAPLTIRPASRLEGSPDVAHPRFSNCTVPMVIWSHWVHNYMEWAVRVPSRVSALLAAKAMSPATTLVVGTPLGERAPGFAAALLRPFTPHPIVSFSEFSRRPAPGEAGDGGRERCFERAYLCAFLTSWAGGVHSSMQAVVRHYEREGGREANPLGFTGGQDVLKVLIDDRPGAARSILNAEQLAERCNSQAAGWSLDPASPFKRVECRATSFGSDTAGNMLAARSADVLVSVHGAGAFNWLAMKPGSALLEIRPYRFGAIGWADGYFPTMGSNQGHVVLWYGLNVEAPLASQPSLAEAAHAPLPPTDRFLLPRFARDRHTWLPFGALREVLQRVAAAGRDKGRYLQQRQAGRHHWTLLPGRTMRPKGKLEVEPIAVGTGEEEAADAELAKEAAASRNRAGAAGAAAAGAGAAWTVAEEPGPASLMEAETTAAGAGGAETRAAGAGAAETTVAGAGTAETTPAGAGEAGAGAAASARGAAETRVAGAGAAGAGTAEKTATEAGAASAQEGAAAWGGQDRQALGRLGSPAQPAGAGDASRLSMFGAVACVILYSWIKSNRLLRARPPKPP